MTWTCAACGAEFTRFGPAQRHANEAQRHANEAQRHANEAHHGARISVNVPARTRP